MPPIDLSDYDIVDQHVHALLAYMQCDVAGVTVVVSRTALRAVVADHAKLKRELAEARCELRTMQQREHASEKQRAKATKLINSHMVERSFKRAFISEEAQQLLAAVVIELNPEQDHGTKF